MHSDENAPRVPSNPALLDAIGKAMDYWSGEFYRRRNHDEKLCPPVELSAFPETLEEWKLKRQEIKKLFEEHIYGPVPPPPDKLEMRLLSEKRDALNDTAIRREIRIYCKMNDGRSHDFDMLLYIPKNVSAPPPVFVGLNFDGNQANTPEVDVRTTRGAAHIPGNWWRCGVTAENKRLIKLDSWNFENAMQRGYAVATANYGEIFPDNPFGYEQSIYTLFKTPEELKSLPDLPAPLRKFGAISAWAWGLSRMLDALETIPEVDAGRAAVLGHSRLGKTALWAGANDERFKMVISNNSGCLGAAPSCREFGERVGHLAYIQRFWFVETLMQYAYRENTMPVDQHQLLALVAPRTLYVASSSEDHGADPKGEFMSARAASAVWKLYGSPAGMLENMPEVGAGTAGSNGVFYHVKYGPHSITGEDWQHYYDCADKIFNKR